MFRELWRRLGFLWHKKRFEEDLAEEMRLHLDLRAADEGSNTAARVRFGNESLLRERSREAWGWTFAETLWRDIRYAARDLNSSRGFTAVAVLSLALGIGANTAIFSILNAVMLRSLPVEDPAQLVQVETGKNSYYTNPLWEQIRDQATGLAGMLAYSGTRFDLSSGGVSEPIEGIWVSGDYFRVLGVLPLRGRLFTKGDDRRGGGKSGAVAVISYAFWKSHFAGDSDVIGKTLHLDRHPFQIIGVTPEWFHGLELDHGYGVAIPIACDPILHADGSFLDKRSTWWLSVLGRRAPGVSVQQVQARIQAVSKSVYLATLPADWSPDDKKEYLNSRLNVVAASTGFSGTGSNYKTALFVLMGVVGLVLLIACANVSNLLLARAAARQRDMAVRMAIGAGRLRLIRQLLTESFMLAALGATAGLLFALWGSRLLIRLLSATGQQLEFDLSIDGHLLLFTLLVTITGILFGLVPALKPTRVSPNQTLKEGIQGGGTGFSRFNLGSALVIGQVALTLILLVGAGLFISTLNHILHVDVGFDTHNVLIARVDILAAGVPKERRARLFSDMLEHLRGVPGVSTASSSALTPISGMGWNQWTFPAGKHAATQNDENVYLNRVSPGYFHTMGTPMLLGRDFSEHDSFTAPKTIILSETTARAFYGTENPVGKMVGMENEANQPRELFQVIGVVKDAKYQAVNQAASFKTAFLAASQDKEPWSAVSFEIRSSSNPEGLEPRIRDAITNSNRDASIVFQSFETQVNDSVRQQGVVALLSGFFGLLALMLAMMGLYGVTAYSVARRQSEIGIRMALGAQKKAVLWLVMRSVWLMLAIGTVMGMAGALLLGRLVASLLFGVKANDTVTLAAAALALGIASTVAAFLPARRAARLDPMRALRAE